MRQSCLKQNILQIVPKITNFDSPPPNVNACWTCLADMCKLGLSFTIEVGLCILNNEYLYLHNYQVIVDVPYHFGGK